MNRRAALSIIGLGLRRLAMSDGADLAYPVPEAIVPGRSWNSRRSEILQTFAQHVYGETPPGQVETAIHLSTVDHKALNGAAIRKQITIHFGEDRPAIRVLLYLPAAARRPVPVFVGLSFAGVHTVALDSGVPLPQVWVRNSQPGALPAANNERLSHTLQAATEETRGRFSAQWQVEKILAAGFGLAVAYYGDIEPDFDGGRPHGVRALFPDNATWGALGAWAWGYSRIADYLASDHDVDTKCLALIGHSRLGKAGLWAAAQDGRFALVVSNESGMGGASLYRAKTGETIEHLNTAFPHWFCKNFHAYTGRPGQVPVDGNLLLSLMAPRPLYVASAQEDRSSNPAAEFYSAVLAGKVYGTLGRTSLGTEIMPPLESPIMHDIGYHVRSGKHDVTAYDWDQYLKFATMHFQK